MSAFGPTGTPRIGQVLTALVSALLVAGFAPARKSGDARDQDPRLEAASNAYQAAYDDGDNEAKDVALRERLRLVREIYGSGHLETARALIALAREAATDDGEHETLILEAIAILRALVDEAERLHPNPLAIGPSDYRGDPYVSGDPVLNLMGELIEAESSSGEHSPATLDRAFARAMAAPPASLEHLRDIRDPAHPVADALAEGGRWTEARAIYSRYPAGSEEGALELLKQASLHEGSGEEFDDVAALREALTILVGQREQEDEGLSHVALLFASHLRGNGIEAAQIVAELEAVLGPDHAISADFMREQTAWLGLNALGTERIEETSADCRQTVSDAVELTRQALAIDQQNYPADSYELLFPTIYLAGAYMDAGELGLAESHYVEAARISLLYGEHLESLHVIADLGSVRLRMQMWTEALGTFEDGLALLREAGVDALLTESNRNHYSYSFNRGIGDAAVQLGDYATAASAYGRATPGSPIVDCFSARTADNGYDWTCQGQYSTDFCNTSSVLDEAVFLDAHARALTATGRSPKAARLAWFASVAVTEHTRRRYTLDPRGRSEFGRYQHTHRTFVDAAWAGSGQD